MAPKEHGTYTAYTGGCRCRECKDAKSIYERAYRRRQAEGRSLYVEAAPVREHIEHLQQAGMGLRTIARESGISHAYIRRLTNGWRWRSSGPMTRVLRERADRLLAVRVKVHGRQKIDSTQTWDYIDEMIACGLKRKQIASALAGREVKQLRIGKPTCEARTARKVEALHWSLWKTTAAFRLRCSHEPPAYVLDWLQAS